MLPTEIAMMLSGLAGQQQQQPQEGQSQQSTQQQQPQKTAEEVAAEAAAAAAAASQQQQQQQQQPSPEELQALEENLKGVLAKKEEELTTEDKALLEKNKELAEKIKNTPQTLMAVLIQEEGYLDPSEVSKYGDNFDDLKSYLQERDKKRDNKTIDLFLQAAPEMRALYTHLYVDKKPLETFLARQSQPAILKMEIPKLEANAPEEARKAAQKTYTDIIRETYKEQGFDSYMVEAAISKAETEGKLYDLAVRAQTDFKKNYEAKLSAAEKELVDKRNADIDAYNNNLKLAKQVIQKNDFGGGLKIPTADARDFEAFVSAPVGVGEDGLPLTLADKRFAELSLGEKLFLDYIVFKKFKGIGLGFTQNPNLPFLAASKENKERTQVAGGGGTGQQQRGFDLSNLDVAGIAKARGI